MLLLNMEFTVMSEINFKESFSLWKSNYLGIKLLKMHELT